MTSSGIRNSRLWTLGQVAVIVACGVQIVYPPTQHFMPFMVPFKFVLMPFYFYLLIRSLREDKTANLSLGEIYTQARRGRRFQNSSLTLAATVALILTSIYSSSSQG